MKNQKKKILTAYGYRNSNKVGYAVHTITDKDISPAAIDVASAVRNKISGVKYGEHDDITQAIVRGGSMSLILMNYALVVIDGVPLQTSGSMGGFKSSTLHIDPQNIASVTVLKSLASTNRFGSEGKGGAILITTKTATFKKKEKKGLTILNKNIYDEKKLKKSSNTKIPYIIALSKFKKLKDAYNYYLKDRNNYLNKPEYFINAYKFFKQTDQKVANTILSNIIELFSEDINVLRTLAFVHEAEGNYQDALTIYQRILKLDRKSSQTYLDLLNTNALSGNTQNTKELLTNITGNKVKNDVNFSGLQKTLTNDVRSIIHNTKLDVKNENIASEYTYNAKYDTRIVVRWNNPNAEFDIQFVNPMKRFTTWEHTNNANNNRIIEEIQQGYFSEEFTINAEIKELKGNWIMNIRDYGSNKLPNYFLITMYKNFGKPNQSKQVKLFTSNLIGENQNVINFKI